eukprot:CAMPEP_0174929092 /NCGR_PEP_ID=MMETSP1355-20121228/27021_1 /TAXON_ID=464990 /ORGANISM="Hemiselmis tepida, Strain CCMP443" /LENGTH=95 /DNA_ID=CAMNT_0016175281 /DNA_START=416 /DNA_END=703 /DNA_ORIENTATION=-
MTGALGSGPKKSACDFSQPGKCSPLPARMISHWPCRSARIICFSFSSRGLASLGTPRIGGSAPSIFRQHIKLHMAGGPVPSSAGPNPEGELTPGS